MNKFVFPAIASLCVATATFLIAVVHAQDSKNAPYYEKTLKAGFTPDPFVQVLKAGGSAERVDGKVKHYVNMSPDFRLNYTAGDYPLFIRVESAGDTTLYIRGPGGVTYFNDDYQQGSLNPGIDFTTNRPKSGVYDIWVGSLKKAIFRMRN